MMKLKHHMKLKEGSRIPKTGNLSDNPRPSIAQMSNRERTGREVANCAK